MKVNKLYTGLLSFHLRIPRQPNSLIPLTEVFVY